MYFGYSKIINSIIIKEKKYTKLNALTVNRIKYYTLIRNRYSIDFLKCKKMIKKYFFFYLNYKSFLKSVNVLLIDSKKNKKLDRKRSVFRQ